jgi:3-methyladenine DNA glycosylase AlkD
MTNSPHHKSLETQIRNKLGAPTKNAKIHAHYIGAQGHPARKKDEQSKLIFLGTGILRIRKLTKEEFQIGKVRTEKLSSLSRDEQWQTWISLASSSHIYEVRSTAYIHLAQKKFSEQRMKYSKELFSLADSIDNWALSDTLSSMLAAELEREPRHFKIFKTWNRSANPWLRRQSLVGLYYYARLRKDPLPTQKTLPLVEQLLEDSHFYVQRGVGWTLREIDRVDSQAQRKFVEKNLHKISPTAWFATSELYSPNLRKKLVQKRKRARTHSI